MQGIDEQLIAAVDRVRQRRFPGAGVVLLAGSAVHGNLTAHSDIDLVVLYESHPHAFRETFRTEGYLFEAFAYDRETLRHFLTEVDRPLGIPVLAQMVCDGIEVPRPLPLSEEAKALARRVLSAGPPAMSEEQRRTSRYVITDLLDDLREPRPRDELMAICVRLYETLANYYFRSNELWSARGKHIPRELARHDAKLSARFATAFDAAFSSADMRDVIDIAEQILKPGGGLLSEGYRADAPPNWRKPSIAEPT